MLLETIQNLLPQIIKAAQTVYDAWEQDENGEDPEYGSGGICQDVAEAIAGVLNKADIETHQMDNNGVGEQHVWCVAYDDLSVISVDIPAGIYETGGGYNWKKRKGIAFVPDHVDLSVLDLTKDEILAINE